MVFVLTSSVARIVLGLHALLISLLDRMGRDLGKVEETQVLYLVATECVDILRKVTYLFSVCLGKIKVLDFYEWLSNDSL